VSLRKELFTCLLATALAGGCASSPPGGAERRRWDRTRMEVALQLADEHIATGKLGRARALLADFSPGTESGQYDNDGWRLQLARARIDVEDGNYADALQRLEMDGMDVSPLRARSAQFHHLRGVAYEGLGRRTEAVNAYQHAYAREPTAERLVAWMDMLVLDGQAQEAGRILQRERRAFPGNVGLHAAAARLYTRLGDAQAAADELRAALLLEPESAGLRQDLARACMAGGDYSAAISAWRELAASTRDEEKRQRFRQRLASCLLAAGQYAEAARTYRTMVSVRSDDVEAQAGLALATLADGRPAEALQAARRALRLDPEHVEARLIAALSHARLGQSGKAVEALSQLPDAERDQPLVREMHARWPAGSPDN
jgi:tetratricopeptide (TPR) repeat protein